MLTKLDGAKAELLERAAASDAMARTDASSGAAPAPSTLLEGYYRHTPPEDLVDWDPVDVYGAALSHHRLAEHRPQSTANVRVHTPTVEQNGWQCGHTVVEVVTDDMPFLVDSVTNELTRQDRAIYQVIHPQFLVRRDVAGRLIEVIGYASQAEGEWLPSDVLVESWIHVEIDRETDRDGIKEIATDLRRVLSDVRESVEDWTKMRLAALTIADELAASPPPLPEQETSEARELMRWLADDHFTFLGYCEYGLTTAVCPDGIDEDVLVTEFGTGLGILRSDPRQHPHHDSVLPEPATSPFFPWLPAEAPGKASEHRLLIVTKANSRSTVHRPSYLDYIGVKKFDAEGKVIGERRFLGLFSSSAYTESVRRMPVIRRKVQEVLEGAGRQADSHDGRDLVQILETYPRDELFQIGVEELRSTVTSVLYLQERRRLRLYLRQDEYRRYYSALVYLPRDRFTTAVRLRLSGILLEELGAQSVDFSAWHTESVLSRLHFVIRADPGTALPELDDADVERIEDRLAAAARSWADGFAEALNAECGEERAAELSRRYAGAFPEGYRADFAPRIAVADLQHIESLGKDDFALSLYEPVSAGPGERRAKLYRTGAPMSLSAVLPVLQGLGVEVVDERPYELRRGDRTIVWIYDFGLRSDAALRGVSTYDCQRFEEAFAAVWTGAAENDGFNALVLQVGLRWREAMVVRAYARYWRQLGPAFGQDAMEAALRTHPHVTRQLLNLFQARLSPDHQRAGSELVDAILEELDGALDQVSGIDDDRILRSFLILIKATLRTNYFRHDDSNRLLPYVSLKFHPMAVPDLPEPRPLSEVWVYSPRLEGTYMRFGMTAPGAPLWLGRREDFRAEVLRLAVAETAGSAAAAPLDAKGGFVSRRSPDPDADRDAWRAEGVACYRTFLSGLFDITDNVAAGSVVPPPDVVRHDGNDTYLLPAPELRGALPYDVARAAYLEVAAAYGFWLRDTLSAHPPSVMVVTARGAWATVAQRFHELGRDTRDTPLTVVGTGKPGGDLFGEVLSLSPEARLVAAFDDEYIFLDPAPDAATAHAERRRLSGLPSASWGDYDASLISKGGGVFSRRAGRPLRVGPAVRELLGLTSGPSGVLPQVLLKAILQAPVDLLLLGGHGVLIGTPAEQPATRVDQGTVLWADVGALRADVVAELADDCMTPAARDAYALSGGRIGLPAADMIAGPLVEDTRTNMAVATTALGFRRETWAATHEAERAASATARKAVARAAHLHRLVALEARQSHMGLVEHVRAVAVGLRGSVEPLSGETVEERQAEGRGMTLPELTLFTVQAHAALRDAALEARLPSAGWKEELLERYFSALPTEYRRDAVAVHPLRDAIAASELGWRLLEELGPARPFSLAHLADGGLPELVAAFAKCRAMLADTRAREARSATGLAQLTDTAVGLARRQAVSGALLWMLVKRPMPERPRVALRPQLWSSAPWSVQARAVAGPSADDLVAIGVPEEHVKDVSVLACMGFALDAGALAARTGEPAAEVAQRYIGLVRTHGVAAAVTACLAALRREDGAVRQMHAIGAVRHDLLLRVALDGPPQGGEWRSRAMESLLGPSDSATAAFDPRITAALAGLREDLALRLEVPLLARGPAAPAGGPAPSPGKGAGA